VDRRRKGKKRRQVAWGVVVTQRGRNSTGQVVIARRAEFDGRSEGDEAVDADPKLIIVILRTLARGSLAILQKARF
jgi:hypothetical protein